MYRLKHYRYIIFTSCVFNFRSIYIYKKWCVWSFRNSERKFWEHHGHNSVSMILQLKLSFFALKLLCLSVYNQDFNTTSYKFWPAKAQYSLLLRHSLGSSRNLCQHFRNPACCYADRCVLCRRAGELRDQPKGCLPRRLGTMITNITFRGNCPRGWGGGTPIWNRWGCWSEILNLTPKGDHLGVAQAFCDP